MAIIYSYPLNTPKRDDLLIGTITYDEDAVNPVHGNPTVSFTIGSLLDLVSGQGNAQNLQQVTNIGNTTTNSIVISNNLLVSGGYYDSSNQPGTAGQLLSSTATGTQWVNVAAQGVTSVGLSMPAAFTVANSPITQAGILAVTGAGTTAQYIDGTGALQTFTTYGKWVLAGDTGVQDVTAGQTASILGGTDIGTIVASPRTLTINHSAVTRSNTTATASPNPGDTVDLVSGVSSSTTGHVTGVETTTVTWPANQNTTYTIDVPTATTSINLKGSDSTDDPIALVGGTNITITRDSDSSLTWDSLNTEYTAGIGLTLNTLEFDVNVDATPGNAPEGLSTDASRTYAIQLDNNSTNLVVNVPWDDTIQTITGAGTDNTDSGVLLSDSGGTVLILGSGSVTASQTGNTITLTGTDTDTGITGVTLAIADSTGAPLSESITNRELTLTSHKYVGGANVGYVPEGGTATTYLKGDGTWAAIPTGLQFKGTWDASGGGGGSPDLTLAANKGAGFLWICDVAGTAYPNGGTNEPSTWNLGDWAVYDGTAWTRVPATNSGVTSLTTTDGTYIDLTPNAATTGAITVTADLNATGTQDATTFLRGDNTWGVPSYTVDTTYTIDVPSATTSINLKGSDGTDDAIVLTGGTNVTLSRTDASTIDIAATNTTYTAGNGLNLSGTVFSADINNTQADAATQALDASPPANRFYAVQLDNNATIDDANLVVNIPWTDTQNPNQTLLGVGSDNTNSGVILNESGGTVLILGATGIAASQATNTVTLTGTTYDINFEPNAGASPQINPFLRLTGTGTASGTTDLEIVGTGATTVTRNNDNKITINSAAGSYSWKVRDSSDVDGTVLNTEYLQFVTATGALATDLTGTGTNTDPYIMTLTSPNTMGSGFTVSADTNTAATTITQGDTLTIAGGTNVSTVSDPDGTITINATDTNTKYDLSSGTDTTLNLFENEIVATADVNGNFSNVSTINYDNESPAGGIVNGQLVTGTGLLVGTRVVSHTTTTLTFNQAVNVPNNAPLSFKNVDTVAFTAGSNVTLTGTSNSIEIAADDDDTLYDLAGAASTTAGQYNLVLSADSTAQDTMVFKQGSNITFTRAANLLTITAANDNDTYTLTSTGKVITLNDVDAGSGVGTVTFVDGSDIAISSAADNTITITNEAPDTGLPAIIVDDTAGNMSFGNTNVTAETIRTKIGAGTGDGVVESITTTGTSGAATLSAAGVLNIPEYENTQENTKWYVRDSGDDDKTVNNAKYLKFVTATGTLGTNLTGEGSTGNPYVMTLTSPDTNTNTVTRIREDSGSYRTGDITLQSGTNVTISEPSTGVFNFAATNTEGVTNVAQTHEGNAFSVAGTPITSSGTLAIEMEGSASQYINGLGNLITFPTIPQGDVTGISVSNGITGSSLSGPIPAISMSGSYSGTFSVIGTGWLTAEGNVANTNPPISYGVALGWNQSGGSAESNLWFRDNTTSHANNKLDISSYNGTSDERILRLHGNKLVDFNGNASAQGTTFLYNSGATSYLAANKYTLIGNHSNPTNTAATFYDQAGQGPTISGFAVCFRTGSTPAQTGKLDSGGTFTVSGDIVAYGSPSDVRLKENIKPIESALDKAMKLQGVTFNWKNKSEDILDIKEDIGFIAQDVQKVLPELVRENDNGMLSMRHQGITPILLEAIKELKAEIEELKSNKCNCNK